MSEENYEQLMKEAERVLAESKDVEQVECSPTREKRKTLEPEPENEPEERRPTPKRRPTQLELLNENVESVEKYRPESYFGCLGCAKEILERRAFKEVQYCIPCRLALGLGGMR